MPSSNDKTQTSTQTSTMFPALQKGWEGALKDAHGIYEKGDNRPPYLAPLNGYSTEALNQTANIARQGVPGLNNAFGFANGLLANNGMTAGMNEAAGYLKPFADGSMQEDPRLQAMLDTNANRAANAAATRFGGGRYGSAAIGNGVGTAVTDANNGTMLQSNENARNRQMAAAGQLGSMYQAGVGNAMQAGAMLPALNNLQYDGASRLAGVGDFYQQRDQQNKDIGNNWLKDNLAWYTGILGGMGNLGNTTTTTTPKKSPSLAQGVLGGAATGGALFGPWGALGGGILGAFS